MKMKWYHYLACFFAGLFLANTIPHFVHGVSGDPFPSPFANPPGKGLSSPLVNVLWGLANLVVGYILARTGRVFKSNVIALIIFFVGVALISIQLAVVFAGKMH
jgi:hypothetical protein